MNLDNYLSNSILYNVYGRVEKTVCKSWWWNLQYFHGDQEGYQHWLHVALVPNPQRPLYFSIFFTNFIIFTNPRYPFWQYGVEADDSEAWWGGVAQLPSCPVAQVGGYSLQALSWFEFFSWLSSQHHQRLRQFIAIERAPLSSEGALLLHWSIFHIESIYHHVDSLIWF